MILKFMLLKPLYNLKAGVSGFEGILLFFLQNRRRMGKIISLKYDFSFKYLFRNEEVRRRFISDVLGILPEEIRSVRLTDTWLWKQYWKQKQGILDVVMELNGDSRVNVELQIEMMAYWDRRSLFYWSKMFADGLLTGQKYDKLKKCICINILGFKLDSRPEYHKVYRLQDGAGQAFSDRMEIHVIELTKTLNGADRVDEWIRLFNAETEEELDMLEAGTKNPGILEAIKEVRVMSLKKTLRMMHEAKLKEIRDRNAREDYVRAEGREEGKAEGKAESVLRLLSEAGTVPDFLRRRILQEQDPETLDRWLLIAARAENIESFRKKAGMF